MTLEDVIEYILGDEIQDETDRAGAGEHGHGHGDRDGEGPGSGGDGAHTQLRYQRAVSDFGRLPLLDRTLREQRLEGGETRVGGWLCVCLSGVVM